MTRLALVGWNVVVDGAVVSLLDLIDIMDLSDGQIEVGVTGKE